MANYPSKSMGLAKFSSNFKGLAVSFFGICVRFAVSIFFFTKLSRGTDLFVYDLQSGRVGLAPLALKEKR